MKKLTKKLFVVLMALTFFPLGQALANDQGVEDKSSCFEWDGNVIVSFKKTDGIFDRIYDRIFGSSSDPSFCNNEEVVIPKGAVVGKGAFSGSNIIKKLIIEENVTVHNSGFSFTENLEEVVVSKGSHLGFLAFHESSIKKLTLEENVTVGSMAFADTENLEEVVIPSGTILKDHAFIRSGIKKLTLAAAGLHIGSWAFNNTKNLEELVIPNGTVLGGNAFSRSGIKKLTLGEGVTAGEYAFRHTENLEKVVIPEGTVLAENTFWHSRYDDVASASAKLMIGDTSSEATQPTPSGRISSTPSRSGGR